MNVSPLELARLSDLAVTLCSRTLERPEIKEWQRKLTSALQSVEAGYLRHVNMSSTAKVHIRVYRRLVTALDWYRQSFGSRVNEAEAIVALAVAFETLLTDFYAPRIGERIERRLKICLEGDPNLETYAASAWSVYKARSEIVHTGDGGHRMELHQAQAAFAKCFCELASRLDQVHGKMQSPIGELLKDWNAEGVAEVSLPASGC